MAKSLRGSVDVIFNPAKLDTSVSEVFGTMLGMRCERGGQGESPVPMESAESVTAVVGFGGVLSGACVVFCDVASACTIVSRMTGATFEAVDDTVKDGIGEVCNMLAGAWKGTVPELSANCGLSVPAVITGRDYNFHVQTPEFTLRQGYDCDDAHFEVMIVCDRLI